MIPKRTSADLFVGLLAAGGVLAAGILGDGGDRSAGSPSPSDVPTTAPGTPAKFALLSEQRSNRCDLRSPELMGMEDDGRLQGSCCFPMDTAAYQRQVRELGKYSLAQIPRDPYDIPVSLAKQLLRYRATIELDAAEQATYRQAMRMSDLGGPCCCPCWRWQAFGGLAKYLIAGREWQAPELAALIDALDGCGGPSDADSA